MNAIRNRRKKSGSDKSDPLKLSSALQRLSVRFDERTLLQRDVSKEEVVRLVHELDVHRVELESQNEELRQTHQELEDSRRRYADLYEYAPAGYFTFDKNGMVVGLNERGARMLGREKASILGMPFSKFIAGISDRQLYRRAMYEVLTGTRSKAIDVKLQRADNTTFDARMQFDVAGEQDIYGSGCRIIIVDISDRSRLQEALRQSEERYRLLFDRSPLEKWVFDLETFRILEANEAAVLQYGYSREEFHALTLADIRTPDEFVKLEQWVRTCCARGEKFEGYDQTRHRRKNGEIIDVDVRYTEISYNGLRAGLGVMVDITERKKTAEALQRSQMLLAEAEKLSHTGAWEWDVQSGVWTFSDEWQRIHGTVKKTLSPDELLAIVYPDDRPVIRRAFEDVKSGSGRYDIVHRIIRRDNGEVRVVRASGQYVTDNAGKVVRVYGFAQDITEQKRAEADLEAQRRLLETVVNYIPAAVSLIRGSDLRLQLVNPAYQAIAPGKQMVGRTLDEIWSETGRNFSELCRRVLETGEPYHVDDDLNMIRRTPGGPLEKVYFGWSLHRMRLPGNEGWGILNTAWETTDRKEAEEALRKSEERFRVTQELSPDGFTILQPVRDEHGGVVDFVWVYENAAIARLNGTDPGAVRGRRLLELFPEHAGTPFHKSYIEVARTGEPRVLEAPFENHVTRKQTWFRVAVVPIGTDIAVLAQDITERKRTEQELERLIQELQRSNRELQQFAYIASHDLQEPLRTVSSYVELLALKYAGKIDRTADRYITFAVEGANRMSELLNDLLVYSRVGTPRGKPFGLVNMRSVFERAAGNLRRAVKESAASITADDLPEVPGDESMLVLLMQNLLANAIKFRRPGLRPEIGVSARRGEHAWIFEVRDNGIGIEPRFFERIFVIFQRLHTREEYAGTGVGLAICRRIVERHGGRIWVESMPGEGSRFYFSIHDREADHGKERGRQVR